MLSYYSIPANLFWENQMTAVQSRVPDLSASWEKGRGTYVADFRTELDHIAQALSTEANHHQTCFCDDDARCAKLIDGQLCVLAEVSVVGEAGRAETMHVSLVASQARLKIRFEQFAPDVIDRVIVNIVDSL